MTCKKIAQAVSGRQRRAKGGPQIFHRTRFNPTMLMLSEDPLPRRSVSFRSEDEVTGFVHSVLDAISRDLGPKGMVMGIHSAGDERTKRILADASIARQAMALKLPQSSAAVDRRNDNAKIEMLLALLHDAKLILQGTVDLLMGIEHGAFSDVVGGYALRGQILNKAQRLMETMDEQFGVTLGEMQEQAKNRYQLAVERSQA